MKFKAGDIVKIVKDPGYYGMLEKGKLCRVVGIVGVAGAAVAVMELEPSYHMLYFKDKGATVSEDEIVLAEDIHIGNTLNGTEYVYYGVKK